MPREAGKSTLEIEPDVYECDRCLDKGWVQDVNQGEGQFGETVPCDCNDRLKMRHLQNMRKYCELPSEYQAWTFNSLEDRKVAVWKAALEFSQQFANGETDEKWLVLSGENGTGKTRLAVAVVNQRLAKSQVAKYVYVPDLLRDLQASFSQRADEVHLASFEERFKVYLDVPLLLLDDLGKQRPTAFSIETMGQLIDYRLREGLELIVTTNKKPSDLPREIADRLMDKRRVKGFYFDFGSYRTKGI